MSKPDLNQEAADGIVNRRFLRLNGYSHDEINVIEEKALSLLFADAADDRKAEVQRMADAIAAAVRQEASQPDPTADVVNPINPQLPYAIRAYDQARKADAALRYFLAEQERKEVDSLSRDKRDWHGPGERSEAIGRIRWRYKDRSDLKDMAQTCVESEVARLAEAFMPSAIANADSGQRWSEVVREAFIIAERFIDERDRRALAIRSANVDSILESGNG